MPSSRRSPMTPPSARPPCALGKSIGDAAITMAKVKVELAAEAAAHRAADAEDRRLPGRQRLHRSTRFSARRGRRSDRGRMVQAVPGPERDRVAIPVRASLRESRNGVRDGRETSRGYARGREQREPLQSNADDVRLARAGDGRAFRADRSPPSAGGRPQVAAIRAQSCGDRGSRPGNLRAGLLQPAPISRRRTADSLAASHRRAGRVWILRRQKQSEHTMSESRPTTRPHLARRMMMHPNSSGT